MKGASQNCTVTLSLSFILVNKLPEVSPTDQIVKYETEYYGRHPEKYEDAKIDKETWLPESVRTEIKNAVKGSFIEEISFIRNHHRMTAFKDRKTGRFIAKPK